MYYSMGAILSLGFTELISIIQYRSTGALCSMQKHIGMSCMILLSPGVSTSRGYELQKQHSSFLRYEKQHDHLYLADLAFIRFSNPEDETSILVEDNISLEAFNIWHHVYGEQNQIV
ncbi:hypothetical protein BDV28DRAFT_145359 [Aspergillus coremiiformis]|uniref:Uncharacterized protein n=1 Tax=Aspergillus coremiiformis TaxID=138285 RepID=A0A5N6ZGH3_9EURO|nr:hypothetical protein BDV28DRAFT_145359 [Aspergillus coremiiformis]